MGMDSSTVIFRSADHPGTTSRPLVFGRFLVKPLAATTIPVMIVALALVLELYDPLPFISWSFPLAFAAASVWTWFRMRALIIEIHVRYNGAAAFSVAEVIGAAARPDIQRVFDVRRESDEVFVTIGLTSYRLTAELWEELDPLAHALEEARLYYQ